MIAVTIANPQILRLAGDDLAYVASQFSSRGRMRSLLERLRDDVIIPEINYQFAVGGDPSWEPINFASYIRRQTVKSDRKRPSRKTRHWSGARAAYQAGAATGGIKPLTDTGQLADAAGAKARFHIRNNEMTYGNWPSNRPWGYVHDFGSANGFIPSRPFAAMRVSALEGEITDVVEEWIRENVRRF